MRAFSLIELLAVIAILALVATTVGMASGGGSLATKQHRAVAELAGLVGLVRAEAMKTSSDQTAQITSIEGVLALKAGERERHWKNVALVIAGQGRTVEETPRREVERVDVAFDGLGRTRDRVIVFDGRKGGGRMWALEFDPISGAPKVVDLGE